MPGILRHPQSVLTLLLIIALFALASIVTGQNRKTVTQLEFIQLNVLVTGSQGDPIKNLRQDDFIVKDEGTTQEITHYWASPKPIRYALVIDHTGNSDFRRGIACLSAENLVNSFGPQDEGFILELRGGMARIAQDWTKNKSDLKAALEKLRIQEATGPVKLIDSLYDCLDRMEERADDDYRQAIIVYADGYDTGSRHNSTQFIQKLREHDIQIFALGLPLPDIDQYLAWGDRGTKFLQTITKETGGRAFFPQGKAGFNDAAGKTILYLNNEYTIGIVQSHDRPGSYRKLTVKLADGPGRDEWVVSTRTGYTTVQGPYK